MSGIEGRGVEGNTQQGSDDSVGGIPIAVPPNPSDQDVLIYQAGTNTIEWGPQMGGGAPLMFKGTWDASTNTPTITSGVGSGGDVWIVAVAGSTTIDGESDWKPGDWLVYDDTTNVWRKIDNTDAAHALTHVSGGTDEVDGDRLDIDFSPTRYTPDTTPPEVTLPVELTAHLAGIEGRLAFPPSATNPTGASEGDVYFNTSLNIWMGYMDLGGGLRWLSEQVYSVRVGWNTTRGPGDFLRGPGDVTTGGGSRGLPVPKGTLVGIDWSRTDTDTATIEVLHQVDGNSTTGSAIAESTSTGGTTRTSVEADHDAGRYQIRTKAGSNAVTSPSVVVYYRRRL